MMNIEYIHANYLHEKYVLNQMDVNEQQAYEAFLRNHPEAQTELESARRMIEAIQRATETGFSGDEAIMFAFEENKRDLARVSGN